MSSHLTPEEAERQTREKLDGLRDNIALVQNQLAELDGDANQTAEAQRLHALLAERQAELALFSDAVDGPPKALPVAAAATTRTSIDWRSQYHSGAGGHCAFLAFASVGQDRVLCEDAVGKAAQVEMRTRLVQHVVANWDGYNMRFGLGNSDEHNLAAYRARHAPHLDDASLSEVYRSMMTQERSSGWETWGGQLETQACCDVLGVAVCVVDASRVRDAIAAAAGGDHNKVVLQVAQHVCTPSTMATPEAVRRWNQEPRIAFALYNGLHYELAYEMPHGAVPVVQRPFAEWQSHQHDDFRGLPSQLVSLAYDWCAARSSSSSASSLHALSHAAFDSDTEAYGTTVSAQPWCTSDSRWLQMTYDLQNRCVEPLRAARARLEEADAAEEEGFTNEDEPTLLEEYASKAVPLDPSLEAQQLFKDLHDPQKRGSIELQVRGRMRAMGKLDDAAIDTLFANAASLVSLSSRGVDGIARVQIIGDVQSGKTEQMVACLAKALDHGYDGAVVISGTMNPLRTQTQKRFDAYFANTSPIHARNSASEDAAMRSADMHNRWVWLTNDADIVNTASKTAYSRSRCCLSYLDRDHPERLPVFLQEQTSRAGQPTKFLAVVKKTANAIERYFTRVVKPLAKSAAQRDELPPRVLYLDDESDDRSVYGSRGPARKTNTFASESRVTDPLTSNKLAQQLHMLTVFGVVVRADPDTPADPDEVDDSSPDEETKDGETKDEGASAAASNNMSDDVVAAPASAPTFRLRSLMLRFTATPQANLFERKDSPLTPHAIWLLELPRNNRTYMGLDAWFRKVPVPLLFPSRTRNNDYNLLEVVKTWDEAHLAAMAQTPLQTVPYADWHNYGPSNVVRINGVESHHIPTLPQLTRIRLKGGEGKIDNRQIDFLRHIQKSHDGSSKQSQIFDWHEVPNRIPPSMIQALCDFLLTGAVFRWRKNEQAKQRKKETVLNTVQLDKLRAAGSPSSSSSSTAAAASPSFAQFLSVLCSSPFRRADDLLRLPHALGQFPPQQALNMIQVVTQHRQDIEALEGNAIKSQMEKHHERAIVAALSISTSCKVENDNGVSSNRSARLSWILPSPASTQLTHVHSLARRYLEAAELDVEFLAVTQGSDGMRLRSVRCEGQMHGNAVTVKQDQGEAAGGALPSQQRRRRIVLLLSIDPAGHESFYLCADDAVQVALRSMWDAAEGISAATLAGCLSSAPEDVRPLTAADSSATDDYDDNDRNLSSNLRKQFHCCFFQLSARLDAHELLDDLLTEVWFQIADCVRSWLAATLQLNPETIDQSQGWTELTPRQRVENMFPHAATKLRRLKQRASPDAAIAKEIRAIDNALHDWEPKLQRFRTRGQRVDADSGLSQYAVIQQVLSLQWARLQRRMQYVQSSPAGEGQPIPALAQLIAQLCYISNTGVVRRGNTRGVKGPLSERSMWALDYQLSESNTKPIPENMILVGSNLHTRGITLEGLRVTYYGRATRQEASDTTIQMGRWFGHRTALERDLCTLFIQERSAKTFMALALHHHLLRRAVRKFVLDRKDIRVDPLLLYSFSTMRLSSLADTMVRLSPIALEMRSPDTQTAEAARNNFLSTERLLQLLERGGAGTKRDTCIGASHNALVYHRVKPPAVLQYLTEITSLLHPNESGIMRQMLQDHLDQLKHHVQNEGASNDGADVLHVVVLPVSIEPWNAKERKFSKISMAVRAQPVNRDQPDWESPALFDAQCERTMVSEATLVGTATDQRAVPVISGESRSWFEFEMHPSLLDEDAEPTPDFSRPTQLQRRRPGAPHLLVIRRISPQHELLEQQQRDIVPDAIRAAAAAVQTESASPFFLPALCYISCEPAAEGVAAAITENQHGKPQLNASGLAAIGQEAKAATAVKKKAGKKRAEAAGRQTMLRVRLVELQRTTLRDVSRSSLLSDPECPSGPRVLEWIERRRRITSETNISLQDGSSRANELLRDVVLYLAALPSLWDKMDNFSPLFEPWMEFEKAAAKQDATWVGARLAHDVTAAAASSSSAAAAASSSPLVRTRDSAADDDEEISCRVAAETLEQFSEFLRTHGSYGSCLYLIHQWLSAPSEYTCLAEVEQDVLVLAYNYQHSATSKTAGKNMAAALIKLWNESVAKVLATLPATKEEMEKAAVKKQLKSEQNKRKREENKAKKAAAAAAASFGGEESSATEDSDASSEDSPFVRRRKRPRPSSDPARPPPMTYVSRSFLISDSDFDLDPDSDDRWTSNDESS